MKDTTIKLIKNDYILIIDEKQAPALVSGSACRKYANNSTEKKKFIIKGTSEQVPGLFKQAFKRGIVTEKQYLQYLKDFYLKDMKFIEKYQK